jgi:predicted molibdopterin-dependent oxidoreductase YjgC
VPKGVKRYLQGSHPDRLLDPLTRDAKGFRKAGWEEALSFTANVSAKFRRNTGRMPLLFTVVHRSLPRNHTWLESLRA